MRSGFFLLIRKAFESDLSERCAAVISAASSAECQAIISQCAAGPKARSFIFVDEIVSPESVPAGLFIRNIAEVLQACNTSNNPFSNCVRVLDSVRSSVLSTVLLHCPDPHRDAFVDPRPTLMEAWLQAMIELTKSKAGDTLVHSILLESFVAVISVLFYPRMGRTLSERMTDPGMNLDGPQSLSLTAFLAAFFRLGPVALHAAGHRLLGIINIDVASLEQISHDGSLHGVAIIGAALFRACQGALPPWAVESVPEVYSSLFVALGEDPVLFGLVMRLSMEVRLVGTPDRQEFGGVKNGSLLSGQYFENMADNAKNTFIDEAKQLCRKGDAASWRRLKVVIKRICGGKKREREFGEKPRMTRWEFARV